MPIERIGLTGRKPDHPALAAGRGIRPNRLDEELRLGCLDVARNRTARYARRHRIARPFWPLIATAILIVLIVERSPLAELPRIPSRSHKTSGSRGHVQDAVFVGPLAVDKDDNLTGDGPEPRCQPPASFLCRDAAQAMAFLIRNRGRLDNDVVRKKWDIVDRFSLATALYLREVEANGAWGELDREISKAVPGAPAGTVGAVPKSPRHRKILRLSTEWAARGEEILSGAGQPKVPTDRTLQPEVNDHPGGSAWKP